MSEKEIEQVKQSPKVFFWHTLDENGINTDFMGDLEQLAGIIEDFHSVTIIGTKEYVSYSQPSQDKPELLLKDEGIQTIYENYDSEVCPRCEGNGRVYDDGKAHFYSENAPTMPCPQCGGFGKVMNERDCVREGAIAQLAKAEPLIRADEARKWEAKVRELEDEIWQQKFK